jgi:hypothetical protein
VKLPGYLPGLPAKATLFSIVPRDLTYKAGLAVHVPVKSNPKLK